MDAQVEHEICGNCKKEIPQPNYVMHTAHCARNITLCQICKEPIPKNQFDEHKKSCIKPVKTKKTVVEPPLPPLKLENSHYYQERKTIEDRKIAARKERELKKYERLVDTGYMLKETNKTTKKNGVKTTDDTTTNQKIKEYQMNGDNRGGGGSGSGSDSSGAKPKSNIVKKLPQIKTPPPATTTTTTAPSRSVGLLACKFCDLELPKLELDDHENYCGSRTDKCLECGELVMFKYKQIHMDSNHGFLKLKDEPGPRPSWESTTNRETTSTTTTTRPRATPFIPFTTVDATLYSFPSTLRTSQSASELKKDKGESYKEITRRLDCKTEYIRNLLHDSASITVPLRHNGAVPRNHFNHNKGPAPQPPRRRPNPPTELLIPCEFCQTPIPHEDLIQHETGCRPDLARYNPRRRSSLEADDYFVAPPPSQQQEPSSPEVELPCEFCADMIPASQLLRHQAACI